MDLGAGKVAKKVMNMEKRKDRNKREERCGHRIELRKHQCLRSWVGKKKIDF